MAKELPWFLDEMPTDAKQIREMLVFSAADYDPRHDARFFYEDCIDALVRWAIDYGWSVANELNNFENQN